MAAFNVVRFRIKPGREQDFLDAHRNARLDAKGFRGASLVKTGEQTYCFIGEWDEMSAIAGGRPQMIAILDKFRDTLEDLGGGLGLTDPVSGEAVVRLPGNQ
jgi:quinol monooxygenase YgiN